MNKANVRNKENLFWKKYQQNIIDHADKIAIEEVGGEKITYQDLDKKSDEIAIYINNQAHKFSNYVCVSSKKSIETISMMLGIMKSNRAFIPIDPDLPDNRKQFIIKQSGGDELIYNQSNYMENVHFFEKNNILTIQDEQSVYVIYTSGSTGKPKGVEITYKNIETTFLAVNKKFKVNQQDIILNLAPFNFDLSIYDIFNTLMIGATLIIMTDSKNVPEIAQIIKEKKITLWNSVPMLMEMFTQYIQFKDKDAKYPSMRNIFLSGDKTYVELARKIRKLFPNSAIISMGGATECSIWSNYFDFDTLSTSEEIIPYGYSLEGQKLIVLDEKQNLCETNEYGEICIAGGGVAKGYFKDEQRTKLSFVDSPLYGKIYKTGDVGVVTEQGYINFLGRKDRQIKIRGYRVELDEIENVINRLISTRCAVGIINNSIAVKIMDQPGLNLEESKKQWEKELPSYMLPTTIEAIEDIPLTKNGKIDYKKLFKNNNTSNSKQKEIENLTATEIEVSKAFKNILNLKNIGKTEKLYQLGGNSLMAIQISNLLKEKYESVEFDTIMKYQNIQNIASFIDKSSKNHIMEYSFSKIFVKEYEVNSMQKAMILKQIVNKMDTSYIIGLLIPLDNQVLDIEQMKHYIMNQKDLQFKVVYENQQFLMRYNEKFQIEHRNLVIDDIYKIKEGIKPFDLFSDSLVRMTNIQVQGERNFLLLEIHHLISDGETIYEIIRHLKQPMKIISEIHFSEALNYIQFKREQIDKIKFSQYLNELSTGKPTIINKPKRNETIQLELKFTREETRKIIFLKKRESVSIQTVLSVLIMQCLKEMSIIDKADQYIVGTPVNLRDTKKLEHTLGPLIQMVPFVVATKHSNNSFAQTQTSLTQSITNKYISYDELVNAFGKELFQLVITSFYDYENDSGIKVIEDINLYDEKFGCSFYIYEGDQLIRIVVSTNYFDDQQMTELIARLKKRIMDIH